MGCDFVQGILQFGQVSYRRKDLNALHHVWCGQGVQNFCLAFVWLEFGTKTQNHFPAKTT
jgi:hypothetical protein